jgi:hypothetical protein
MRNFATNIVNFGNKLRRSLQDFPYYGNREACSEANLAEGWLSVDTENKQVRIYDGHTVGGTVLPNVDDVAGMIENASTTNISSAITAANSYTDGKKAEAVSEANSYTDSKLLEFQTLSALLSTTPTAGMRATALDAPGSMLAESGGLWVGSLGYGGWATVGDIPTTNVGAGSTAYLVDGSMCQIGGA